MARFNDQSGQLVPFVAIMAGACALLVIFATGAAASYILKLRLRTAADAAALAAAGQAGLWERLQVQFHLFDCVFVATPGSGGDWVCRDYPQAPVEVKAFRAQLESEGWATEAGCPYTSDGQASVPPYPNPARVCDRWQLQQAGFAFPAASDPQGAAQQVLSENMSRFESHGVQADLESLTTNDTTGSVQLTAVATGPGNPLAIFGGGPLRVVVHAGSRPHMQSPLPELGP